ncbi:MAG: hypothetical protein BWY60_00668 [Actinobacteria bacterium ADurb.Bin346]|nr:MAG: hypothetical protein BWY60_00668 [Actinobacteria bacterium ADurb.Bin346]
MSAHPELLEKDKKTIIENNKKDGKAVCIIDGLLIDSKTEIEFHHINPYLSEEKPDISNIATVCKKHHKELGQLSITEYRTLKQMEDFFNGPGIKKLDDLLLLKLGRNNCGKLVNFSLAADRSAITISINDNNPPCTMPLFTCPSTGFKYFYLVLPIEYVNNDTMLQPRPLELKRLWELYRHLIAHSQLTPSVCRLSGDRIYIFDGQHKAAAQIWAGRSEIECKIYIEPAIKTLKETNLVAHDKLRQMPFFTSVLINKWASIFAEEWKEYMEHRGEKSEEGFVSFLVSRGKKKPEAVHMLESNIYDSILEDSENSIKKYVEEYGAGLKKPLTVNRLRQSILKKFIASPPLSISIEESDRLRELERKNMIRLLNLICAYSLNGIWNPAVNDSDHLVSEKIYLNGSFKAWSAILKDVIANILALYDESERKEIFLREISEEEWELIEKSISILFGHRVWSDDSQENINNLRLSNENLVRKYLSRRGLSANWILNSQYESENNFID